jgi:hypothetical protein
MNWCIGCTGRYAPVSWNGSAVPLPKIPSETFESPGMPVSPESLYLAQLRERLGEKALENIGYVSARASGGRPVTPPRP